jgi:tripartite-type tricarboxylate transporter receptor subunit TctC
MPAEIVSRLNGEISRALADPELKGALEKLSIEASPGSPEAFAAHIRSEWQRWRHFVSASGIPVDK